MTEHAAPERPRAPYYGAFCRMDPHAAIEHSSTVSAKCKCPCHGTDYAWWTPKETATLPNPTVVQTRCRRCLEWNDGDPWYCPRCGKETTLTPHDGGTLGDQAEWVKARA